MSPPKGHRNLGIRGGTTICQGILTLINLSYEVNVPIDTVMAICQFWAGTTLMVQWRTAMPSMFILRAIPSYIRCLLSFYGASCGRRWPWDDCNTGAWSDVSKVFRVLNIVAAVRFFLNGLSLTLQYMYPKRGVGQRGNEQLFYRGCVRLTGIPLHLTRAMLKLGELSGTDLERRPVEIFVNLTRALVIIPIAAWSLLNQWATSGTGRKTDDIRTTGKGMIPGGSPDNFVDLVEPHKGDRNLLARSVLEFAQFFFSMWLVCYNVDRFHMIVQAFCEVVTSIALFVQWKLDHASTHYARAFVSFLTVPSFVHLGICGHGWPGEVCDSDAWSDVRRPFRILMFFAALRMLLNGCSLFLQNVFPDRGVTEKHGNEQLYFRGIIRWTGTPLYLVLTMQSFADFNGTKWERPPIELVVQLIRALVILPLLTCSLAHQWRYTGLDDDPRCSHQGSVKRTSTSSTAGQKETSSNGTHNGHHSARQTSNGSQEEANAIVAPPKGTGQCDIVATAVVGKSVMRI